MRRLLLITICALLASCSLTPQRSFLAEMEHDDSSFFEPRKDFNVIPGDEGISWRTEDVWKARTPRESFELRHEKEERAMLNHLRKLEGEQSEGAKAHYEKIKKHLITPSEKIYFLSLRGRVEREEYLEARGITEDAQPISRLGRSIASAGVLNLGMTKSEIESSWGEPLRKDYAGNPALENERWVYHADGAAKYIFFESGRVGGWMSASE